LLNNSGTLILLVVFIIGAICFAAGTWLIRRTDTSFVDELLLKGDAESVRRLEELRDSAPEPKIREAAEDALLILGSRAN
jgi:hypothetical protein